MTRLPCFLTGLFLIAAAGCSSLSTVNPRAMMVNDVESMTAAGVGAEVIKRQIEATRSRFELSPEEIIRLKRAGVADAVLTAMIDSGERHDPSAGNGVPPYSGYDPYDPLFPGYISPYIVYRNPGFIGRFYSYYPLVPGTGYWNDPYRDDNPYNNDRNPIHPGTGEPINSAPDRNQQDRNQ